MMEDVLWETRVLTVKDTKQPSLSFNVNSMKFVIFPQAFKLFQNSTSFIIIYATTLSFSSWVYLIFILHSDKRKSRDKILTNVRCVLKLNKSFSFFLTFAYVAFVSNTLMTWHHEFLAINFTFIWWLCDIF